MKYLRYMGEFLSVSGVVWRAEIWQESDKAFANVGVLTFDANEPLVIEWGHKSKEEVICGSTATIKIISPGDRTYADLYSIDVGRVRLDVYRDTLLYWSGSIDTEFYEEPYEQLSGYTVSLSFTDFGILGRLKYDLPGLGMQSLYSIITYCVGKCGISSGGYDDSLISTQITPAGSRMRLSDLKVRSDNFYDEDGEALTLAEVIEGILQPLALRMIQKSGKIYIYDINGLYTKGAKKQIVWDGSRQHMGVDAVYNNAKITWNTYAQGTDLALKECWDNSIETPSNDISLNNLDGATKNGATYFSYHYSTDIFDWVDSTDCGFTLWLAKQGASVQGAPNAELLDSRIRFYKIVPQYDGTESEGIALFWKAVRSEIKVLNPVTQFAEYSDRSYGMKQLSGIMSRIGGPIYKNKPVWIPPVASTDDLLIRVSVDMLMDPRFNPFESAVDIAKAAKQKAWEGQFNRFGNFIYVPVKIKYQPEDSSTVYVWTNRNIVTQNAKQQPVTTLEATYGKWVVYGKDDYSPNDWGYLCYYDAKDRFDTSGVIGWKKNRPGINPHGKDTISVLTNAEAGQYIPYPDFGGKGGSLWVEVCHGWYIANEESDLSADSNGREGLWNKISWILMQLPEIEIMNRRQFDKAIDTDDVEYNAQLNTAAKDSIEIDTICGTSADGVPTARGAYFNATTGKQITQLTRAGRTTQAEDLLIGTLYSQFAQRRTTLSGESKLNHDPICTYLENNQPGKLFMVVEDVQDARMDCSEAMYVEIRPDEYKRVKE